MLDRVRVEGESEALVAEIRELGLSYGWSRPTPLCHRRAGHRCGSRPTWTCTTVGIDDASGQITIQARCRQPNQQADRPT